MVGYAARLCHNNSRYPSDLFFLDDFFSIVDNLDIYPTYLSYSFPRAPRSLHRDDRQFSSFNSFRLGFHSFGRSIS